MVKAAELYDRSTHHYPAMRAYENLDEYEKAIEQAKKCHDAYNIQRLEAIRNGTSFAYVDPKVIKEMAEHDRQVANYIRQGDPNVDFGLYEDISKLGFNGFHDKVVADIGARDGRFVKLFRELGASDVYGIDPDTDSLQQAVTTGKLDAEHAINTTLEDIPKEIAAKIESAAVFNFIIDIKAQPTFFQKLSSILPLGGVVLLTVAERVTLDNMLDNAKKYFIIIGVEQRVNTDGDFPHKYFVTLSNMKTDHPQGQYVPKA